MKALLEVYQEKGDHGKAVEEVDSYVPEVFSPIYTITNMVRGLILVFFGEKSMKG